VVDAVLSSWPSEPGLLISLALTAAIYLRGWFRLHRREPQRWRLGQPAAFLGGLIAILLALASPIESFSFLLLQVHMVQHLLLMMAAPPLLWLGEPLFPFLRGLPRPVRTYWIAPLFRSPVLRRFLGHLTYPVTALIVYIGATWLWHLPPIYDVALRSSSLHYVQHVTFLGAGLIFWYPVVRPYPARPHWSRWLVLPFLFLADVQNTVLAAVLTFSDRVLYPYYAEVPRLGGISAVDDQATAGILMWVPGSLAFLVPLFWIATRALFGRESSSLRDASRKHDRTTSIRLSLPVVSATPAPRRWDLLTVPGLGHFLRWRHARLALQLPLLLLAAAVIFDGMTGPPAAPMNLAGVLPWIHWRGFVVIGLLAVGNVFCTACPFMVPRNLARRLFQPRFVWPRRLRNKWLAVALLVVFLWAYEAFALWDSSWWTAWIAVGYFASALVVDSIFRGAAFCKYVCPIGQFNFVQSLVSPMEMKVRDPAVCTRCTTKDCIRGNSTDRGCELNLFLPRKSSNMDCTLCLDCIHACPHDNVAIVAGPPAAELWHDPWRSGVGRFSRRTDLAVLVVILVFGAFANAGGMVGPVIEWQDGLRANWGQASPFWAITTYYVATLLVLPLLVVGFAAWLSQRWSGVATRYVFALIPLGFAMWLSHYCYHLLPSYDAAIPPIQRFAAERGLNLGSPDWICSCCRPVADWLPRLEILVLNLGLLLSLYTGYRIALDRKAELPHTLKPLLSWATLMVLLWATGLWIVLQPMQMRGTMQMAG
jgi:cytochrome c oxidase assembly factor CtaG